MPEPAKYEGPFESQEDEDLAVRRSKHVRARIKKEEEDEEAERLKKENEDKKKKRSGLLPVVD